MKKREMIKSHEEFSEIIQNEQFIKNKNFTLYIRKGKYEYPHFGIAVSKKLGNAVKRNKLKRQMRVILTEWKKTLNDNKDYIIIMKENTKNLSFQEMQTSFLDLVNRKGEFHETKK